MHHDLGINNVHASMFALSSALIFDFHLCFVAIAMLLLKESTAANRYS